MSRSLLLLLGGLAAVAGLATLLFGPQGDAFTVYNPEGYVDEVEQWIADGKLRFECGGGNNRNDRTDRIVVSQLDDADLAFYLRSYLVDDVEAWNGGDRRAFLTEREETRDGCEGRITGVNGSYHNQRLPTFVAEAWEGALTLPPSRGGTLLTSGRRTLEVVPVPWDLLPLRTSAYETVSLVSDDSSRSQRLGLGTGGRNAATLKNVGRDPVLEVLDDARASLALNGCPVPDGWRVRLEGGDELQAYVRGRVDERFLVESGDRSGIVSYLTRVNGEPRRRNYPERLSFARDAAWAVDSVVDAAREQLGGAVRDDFDVMLTLDPLLHHRLEREVAEFARKRYGRRPVRASVTVMDPESGRLLALPSYPRATDLDDLGLAEDAPERALLRLNHNFLQHAVGSAAKPFFAATALAVHPELAELRVPCVPDGTSPTTLLGYDMGPYNLPGDCRATVDEQVDLERSLEVSSNRFSLYLALLAMAEWDGGAPTPRPGAAPLEAAASYALAGRPSNQSPLLPFVRSSEDRPGDGVTPLGEVTQQTHFPQAFESLFGHAARYKEEGIVERFDLDLWRPVLDAPGEGLRLDPGTAVSFSPIAPEAVNLRLNLAQNLRQDIYTLLLGNGDNRWTNTQLAEAMARLITGRRVEARLVERVSVPGVTGEGEEAGEDDAARADEVLWDLETHLADASNAGERWADELPDRLRERILTGMRRVVASPTGTAPDVQKALDALNRRAPAGVTYRALGKTGTPTQLRAAVERSPVGYPSSAVESYGGRAQVKSGVLILAVERGAGAETESRVVTIHVDSQGGSEQARALAVALLPELVESVWPQDWLN